MASDGKEISLSSPVGVDDAREAAMAQEAFLMRGRGSSYTAIAEAFSLKKGWTEAYKLVARAYGDAVASQDKERLRSQEAGRLMYMRALLEERIREGDEKAMEMDLKYTGLIIDVLGLKDGVVSGSGSGGNVAVQVINTVPPWDKAGAAKEDGPAPEIVEGEAVEEPRGGVEGD